MKYAYWLIHNEICARPGPTEYPWQPAALAAGGIRAVLSVNKGDGVSVRDLRRHGISYKKITLPVTTPPTDRDMPICLKKLPKAYDFARQQINEGNPVLVHCRHGNDRTGLFLVYYLVRAENMGVGEAIDFIRARRSATLTARSWQSFAEQLVERLTLEEAH